MHHYKVGKVKNISAMMAIERNTQSRMGRTVGVDLSRLKGHLVSNVVQIDVILVIR